MYIYIKLDFKGSISSFFLFDNKVDENILGLSRYELIPKNIVRNFGFRII